MRSDFKPLPIILALLACWCLMAFLLPTTVVSHSFQLTSAHPGETSTLTLYVRSLLPPPAVSPISTPLELDDAQLDDAQDNQPQDDFPVDVLPTSHAAPVVFSGFSLLGPIWKQTVTVFPVTLEESKSTVVNAYSTPITLPPLKPQLADNLPDAPVRVEAGNDDAAQGSVGFSGLWLLLIPAVAVAIVVWLKLHAPTPAQRLKALPVSRASLDQLPDILASAEPPVTPASAPDFFAKLNSARFSREEPSMNVIRNLMMQANKLLPKEKA